MTAIVLSNEKGGIAKTTTASSLTAGFAELGFKVLGVDFDPQGNLSSSLGAEVYKSPTVYELLKGEVKPEEAIQKLSNYDFIPANSMLAGATQELQSEKDVYRLKTALAPIKEKYDYIVVDTGPSLGILTVNALTFADEVIIPTTAGIFSIEGMQKLHNTISNVRAYCNADLKVAGVLLTRFQGYTTVGSELKAFTEQLAEHLDIHVYVQTIRNAVVVEAAQLNKKDIFAYAPRSEVAEDYRRFIIEYLKRRL